MVQKEQQKLLFLCCFESFFNDISFIALDHGLPWGSWWKLAKWQGPKWWVPKWHNASQWHKKEHHDNTMNTMPMDNNAPSEWPLWKIKPASTTKFHHFQHIYNHMTTCVINCRGKNRLTTLSVLIGETHEYDAWKATNHTFRTVPNKKQLDKNCTLQAAFTETSSNLWISLSVSIQNLHPYSTQNM
jgi:hypothetical protein